MAAHARVETERRFVEEPDSWWDGSGREIDIVAPTNGDTLVVGEVKFHQQPVGHDVLTQLENEATLGDWTPEGGQDVEYRYALFARTDFKRSVKEAAAERDDLQLFSADDVVAKLTE